MHHDLKLVEYVQLGQEITARRPLCDQRWLHAFRVNPEALLSSDCVEARRVEGTISSLMIGPGNSPAYVIQGKEPILVVDRDHHPILASEIGGLSAGSTLRSCELVGFVDERPVVFAVLGLGNTETAHLILGRESIWFGSVDSKVSIIEDGTIFIAEPKARWEPTTITLVKPSANKRDACGHLPSDCSFKRCFLGIDGQVYVLSRRGHLLEVERLEQLGTEFDWKQVPDCRLVDIINRKGEVEVLMSASPLHGSSSRMIFVAEVGASTEPVVANGHRDALCGHYTIPTGYSSEFEYLRGFTAFDDGRGAYVSQWRHGQEILVFGGEPHVAVNTVYAPFKDKVSDRYRYWSKVGGHLLLMELPPKRPHYPH